MLGYTYSIQSTITSLSLAVKTAAMRQEKRKSITSFEGGDETQKVE